MKKLSLLLFATLSLHSLMAMENDLKKTKSSSQDEQQEEDRTLQKIDQRINALQPYPQPPAMPLDPAIEQFRIEDLNNKMRVAIAKGDLSAMSALRKEGADAEHLILNPTRSQLDHDLLKAIVKNDYCKAESCLKSGANTNVPCKLYTIHSEGVVSIDSCIENALALALQKNNTKIIELLIAHKAKPTIDNLVHAWKKKCIDVCTLFIKNMDLNETEVDASPLEFAIAINDKELVTFLLAHGANINLSGLYGCTPLILATKCAEAEGNRYDICELLLQNNANVDKQDANDQSALYHAIDNKKVFKLLLSYGANPNQRVKGSDEHVPLLFAIIDDRELTFEQKYNCCKALLKHNANVNITDDNGNTPLMRAAFIGDKEICELLLEYAADYTRKNDFQNTALDCAIEQNNLLQEALENDDEMNLQEEDENDHVEIIELLSDPDEIAKVIANPYNPRIQTFMRKHNTENITQAIQNRELGLRK